MLQQKNIFLQHLLTTRNSNIFTCFCTKPCSIATIVYFICIHSPATLYNQVLIVCSPHTNLSFIAAFVLMLIENERDLLLRSFLHDEGYIYFVKTHFCSQSGTPYAILYLNYTIAKQSGWQPIGNSAGTHLSASALGSAATAKIENIGFDLYPYRYIAPALCRFP